MTSQEVYLIGGIVGREHQFSRQHDAIRYVLTDSVLFLVYISSRIALTLNAPITTAADDIH